MNLVYESGEVRVRQKDGQVFLIIPENSTHSPLDVESIDVNITTEELVEFIREGRKTY